MWWLIILCGVLAVLAAVLLVKVVLMRKAAEEIREGFAEKLQGDTNTLLSISSRDGRMRSLADSINIQLRELRKERRRFVQGDMELKNAITNISHDIRTPLAAICAYLDLLETCEKSDDAAGYLEIIRSRTDMLGRLTEELFCYSIAASPDRKKLLGDVVVNGVLEESIGDFYTVLRERNITPHIRITEKKILRRLDRASLSRIFTNLISNAIKYSDGDLEIELTDEGEIIFANAASGLDEIQVGRLFDRFYTVENSRKSTGLGLSIARTLVEQMQGTIDAGYEKGRLRIQIKL